MTSPRDSDGESLTSSDLTEKGQRTRTRIIAAAAELIHERGVSATTLNDVRTASAVSSSQLYHYFADKKDLVGAVVDHQAAQVVENQRALDLSTLDAFRSWREDLVAFEDARQGRGGCPLGSLGADLAETDAINRERVALGFQRWARVIELGLTSMCEADELPRNLETRRLSTGILAALQGGLLIGQVDRSADALDAALDLVITLLESLVDRAGDQAEA
nr:TetR/AcrR family transcriptional regulator [Rhodococcus sp. (in: high G+C Gram-positive bacteria)]